MKKIVLTLVIACSTFFVNTQAQILTPVKWSFAIEEVNDWEVKVIATATIDAGWKVYGLKVEEGGPVATKLKIEKSNYSRAISCAVEVTEPKTTFDKMFGMEVPYFKDKAVISQRIRVKKRPGKVTGYIEFMCCDNEKCLPPTEVDFELEIPEK